MNRMRYDWRCIWPERSFWRRRDSKWWVDHRTWRPCAFQEEWIHMPKQSSRTLWMNQTTWDMSWYIYTIATRERKYTADIAWGQSREWEQQNITTNNIDGLEVMGEHGEAHELTATSSNHYHQISTFRSICQKESILIGSPKNAPEKTRNKQNHISKTVLLCLNDFKCVYTYTYTYIYIYIIIYSIAISFKTHLPKHKTSVAIPFQRQAASVFPSHSHCSWLPCSLPRAVGHCCGAPRSLRGPTSSGTPGSFGEVGAWPGDFGHGWPWIVFWEPKLGFSMVAPCFSWFLFTILSSEWCSLFASVSHFCESDLAIKTHPLQWLIHLQIGDLPAMFVNAPSHMGLRRPAGLSTTVRQNQESVLNLHNINNILQSS